MRTIFKVGLLSIVSVLLISNRSGSQSINALPYFSDPAISPNTTEIAFVYGGDIWTVPVSGGEARLLIANPATESRPLYSPDGKSIAFISTRSGNGDIYVFDMSSGKLSRITYDDAADELSAWSKDSKYLYFASSSRDISGMRDVFRVKANGGTPMLVSDNRYVTEFQPAPSPDGQSIAFVARGVGSTQWWRNGHSHLDESELWLKKEGTGDYTKLTERGARQLWPMWSSDGKFVYYISDRDGKENLWAHTIGGNSQQLTNFKSGRMLWPSISANGTTIVFERDFSIWLYNINTGKADKVNITLRGTPAGTVIEHQRLTSGFSDVTVSPDNKKIAFSVRGEIFVAGAKDGGDATRINMTDGSDELPIWAASSNVIYYLSDRNGSSQIFKYDFITNKEVQVTNSKENDSNPLLSPDGKMMSFVREGNQLKLLELSTGKETLITKANIGSAGAAATGSVAWSPDNKWLAFGAVGAKSLYNVYVIPVTGGEARPVSFLANSFGGNLAWAKDGKTILFSTQQRTEPGFIARIDLVPQQPRFREDQFKDLFVDQAPAPKKDPVIDSMAAKPASPKSGDNKIVFDGIRQRLSYLPVGTGVDNFILSKDGNTVVLLITTAGQQNIYSYSLDELSRDAAVLKQITTTAGRKGNIQFSPDGKEVYYTEGGRVQVISLDSKQTKSVAITAEMDVDFNYEKMVMFNEAWDIQNYNFYDEHFHGVDWSKVKTKYEPYAAGSQTPDELRRLLNLMVGELNASHSGVGGPVGNVSTTGRIGLRFDRSVYEKEGRFKITEVVALSPAALSEEIKAGDYLISIDGRTLGGDSNIDQLLDNKTNRKVILSITSGSGGANRTMTVRPISLSTEKGLLYKQWVQQNRDYVSRISNGRLGYIHMFDMGQGSLDQLYIDMDADNHSREGVVVDVRNNNGGFVNVYAIDVLARKGYLTMTRRGLPSAPARVQLGQRALDAPSVLVTNQHSLSDAEDFTEGYRTLGLGKVVGEPTAGWIIFTGSRSLIDGSSIRTPGSKITDNRGQNMELNPRPVDIQITNPLGENGKDRQLDMAVKVLLDQIDKK